MARQKTSDEKQISRREKERQQERDAKARFVKSGKIVDADWNDESKAKQRAETKALVDAWIHHGGTVTRCDPAGESFSWGYQSAPSPSFSE
jgi:hypothetical protein